MPQTMGFPIDHQATDFGVMGPPWSPPKMGSTEAETLGGRVQQEAASSSEGALTITTKPPKDHQTNNQKDIKTRQLAPSNIKRASNDQCSKQTWNSFTDLWLLRLSAMFHQELQEENEKLKHLGGCSHGHQILGLGDHLF